jgi:transposase
VIFIKTKNKMAGKPKSMSLIKQLLRLYQQGYKIKTMAKGLGISKNTVKSYIFKIQQNKWDVKHLVELENPVLEAKFHVGNPAYKDERYEQLKDQLDDLVKELKKTGVTKNLLWEEYRKQYPKGYSRSQFCFHLSQHMRAAKPSMVLEHKAGEKLYMDFAGEKMHYTDPLSGEQIWCEVFICCLPYSDYGFAMAIPSQKSEDFIYALRACFQHLGGVPQVLIPDNMKTAVVKANRYEPDINQILQDFADHYGVVVLPARVRKPRDKALVENHVNLMYTRVYAKLRNEKFFSLTELNMAIQEKMREHNQTRMQEKPYSREEKFLAEEKGLLRALPLKPFELKCYLQCTVRTNNHVKLSEDRHYYSVPYQYIGKKVKIRVMVIIGV